MKFSIWVFARCRLKQTEKNICDNGTKWICEIRYIMDICKRFLFSGVLLWLDIGLFCPYPLGLLYSYQRYLNTLRPRQNGRHFANDIFKRILLNEIHCICIRISLKYVQRGPIMNMSALVQMTAWRRTGDMPLSEPMSAQFTDAYTHPTVSVDYWYCSSARGLNVKYLVKSNCTKQQQSRT